MRIPLHLRQFDILVVNYGLEDSRVVESVFKWLTDLVSHISLCYLDITKEQKDRFSYRVTTKLVDARAYLAFVPSNKKNLALYKQHHKYSLETLNQNLDFCSIALVLDHLLVSNLSKDLKNCKVIKINGINFNLFAKILTKLHASTHFSMRNATLDIYTYRPWFGEMSAVADLICGQFIQCGFRLISDQQSLYSKREEPDWKRVKKTLRTCGGLLCVFPKDIDKDSCSMNEMIYTIIGIAQELEIPYVLAASQEIQINEQFSQSAVGNLSLSSVADRENCMQARVIAETLRGSWIQPKTKDYFFYTTHFRDPETKKNIRQVIGNAASVPCFVGEDIQTPNNHISVQQEIFNLVSQASLVIADISEPNINSLIEAGAARGSGVECYLLSSDRRHKPPFMLRDKQVFYFDNTIELLNLIYKISYDHRKVVFNSEILANIF